VHTQARSFNAEVPVHAFGRYALLRASLDQSVANRLLQLISTHGHTLSNGHPRPRRSVVYCCVYVAVTTSCLEAQQRATGFLVGSPSPPCPIS